MRGWKMVRDRYGVVAKPHCTYPDPDFRPVLRDVIELGCSALTDAELCQELARRHGDKLTTDAMHRDHGEGALLSDALHPTSAIESLYQHIPVYLTGCLWVEGRLGKTQFSEEVHGMPIVWREVQGTGERYATVGNTVVLGTDEDAGDAQWWGIDPVRAMEAMAKRAPRRIAAAAGDEESYDDDACAVGTSSHAVPRKPMGGYVCADEEFQYRLHSKRRDTYYVERRPLSKARHAKTGRPRGWAGAEHCATIRVVDLHQAVCDQMTEAITSGVSATLRTIGDLPTERDPRDEAELVQLAKEIKEASDDLTVFRRNDMAGKVKEKTRALKALTARQDELRNAPVTSRATEGCSTLPALLALLRKTEGKLPVAAVEAIRDVIPELVAVEVSVATVRFGFTVHIPTDDGLAKLNPVWVSVPNRIRGDEYSALDERAREFAYAFLVEGQDVGVIADMHGWDEVNVERRVREYLERWLPSSGLRAAVMDCPLPIVRVALGCALFDIELPGWIDPRFQRRIFEVYTADVEWLAAWAADTHLRRRSAMAYVKKWNRGKGVCFYDLCDALGVTSKTGLIMLKAAAPGGRRKGSKTPDYGATLVRTAPWPAPKSHLFPDGCRVCIAKCPHRRCSGLLDHVLRVPELGADSVLCSTCRRMPSDSRLVFDESYLRLWVGPRGTGAQGTVEGKPVPVPSVWKEAKAA
jgi:hypothetical protein